MAEERSSWSTVRRASQANGDLGNLRQGPRVTRENAQAYRASQSANDRTRMSSPIQINGHKRKSSVSGVSNTLSSLSLALAAHPSQHDPYNATSPSSPPNPYATSPHSAGSNPARQRTMSGAHNGPTAQPRSLQAFQPTPEANEVVGIRLLLLENVRIALLSS